MRQNRMLRLIRLGDAKRLTRGGAWMYVELDGRPQRHIG